MSALIDLAIDDKALDSIAKSMAATEKDIHLALTRALHKTTRWVMTHLARELARDTGLPNAVIKRRLQSHIDAKAHQSRIWLGLSPVSAGYLKPKAAPGGVKAGNKLFKNAFLVKNRAKPQVFKRVSKARLPIERQTVSIEQQADTVIEVNIMPTMNKRLQTLFSQELRWILSQQQ